jgi:hypothetical protein
MRLTRMRLEGLEGSTGRGRMRLGRRDAHRDLRMSTMEMITGTVMPVTHARTTTATLVAECLAWLLCLPLRAPPVLLLFVPPPLLLPLPVPPPSPEVGLPEGCFVSRALPFEVPD